MKISIFSKVCTPFCKSQSTGALQRNSSPVVAVDVEGGRLRRVSVDSEDEGVPISAKASTCSTHVSAISIEDLEPVESNLCLVFLVGGGNIRGTCAWRIRVLGLMYNLCNLDQTFVT